MEEINLELKKEKKSVRVRQIVEILVITLLVIIIVFAISLMTGPQDPGTGYFQMYLMALFFVLSIPIIIFALGSSSKPKDTNSLPKDPNSFSAKSPLKKIMLIVATVGIPLLTVGLLLAIALG